MEKGKKGRKAVGEVVVRIGKIRGSLMGIPHAACASGFAWRMRFSELPEESYGGKYEREIDEEGEGTDTGSGVEPRRAAPGVTFRARN